MLLADTLSETQAVLDTTWVRDRKPEPDTLGELDADRSPDCEGDSVDIELPEAEPEGCAVADPAFVKLSDPVSVADVEGDFFEEKVWLTDAVKDCCAVSLDENVAKDADAIAEPL
jgi:hypothetical protein